MGLFGHWYVIVILVGLFLLLIAPSALPRLGLRFGRRVRETKVATLEAGRSFKDEVQKGDEVEPVPPQKAD